MSYSFPPDIRSDGTSGVIADQAGNSLWIEHRGPDGAITWLTGESVLGQFRNFIGNEDGGMYVQGVTYDPDTNGYLSGVFRINAFGQLASGWPASPGVLTPRAIGPMIADGAGGGYLEWEFDSPATGTDLFGARCASDAVDIATR